MKEKFELRQDNERKIATLHNEGKSAYTIAKVLEIPRTTVRDQIKKLKKNITQAVVVHKNAQRIVDRKINAFDQLNKINADANELLDVVMSWGRGDDEALRILETQVRKVTYGTGDSAHEVTEYKFKDPRELALKCMAEIRGQLKLQTEIMATLFDIQAVSEFQQEVADILEEESPGARTRILQRLEEKRLRRSVVKLPKRE
jgi:hypothetical protein